MGLNPVAELEMRAPGGGLRAHFKYPTPLRPPAALVVRDFGTPSSRPLKRVHRLAAGAVSWLPV